MGVTCQILINRTEDGVFKAGGVVTGTLKYFIDKPTQYKIISMNFVGKGECQWSTRNSNDDDDRTTHYGNREEYVNQIANLYLGTNKKDLLSGAFEYPFQFFLPPDIPPSFKDDICTIKYKITVTFVKANMMKSKNNFDVEIPVTSYVNPCSLEPMMFGLNKSIVSFKPSNKIEVKGEISRTCIAPGENFQMILTVNNDTNLEIDIKTELVSRLTYIASCGEKNVFENVVKDTGTMSSVAKNSIANLICVVPTLRDVCSIQHTKVMIREYKVKVTAKLPFPYINAAVDVPVVIGLRKHEFFVPNVVYKQFNGESSYSSISAQNDSSAKGYSDHGLTKGKSDPSKCQAEKLNEEFKRKI